MGGKLELSHEIIDPKKTTAKYKNGLLKIEVPFLEIKEQHIKVEVK